MVWPGITLVTTFGLDFVGVRVDVADEEEDGDDPPDPPSEGTLESRPDSHTE